MEVINYIYCLVDPVTFERRYIGKTKNIKERYRKHLLPYCLKSNTYKNRWLRKLLTKGLKPLVMILSEVAEWEDVNEIEKFWIRIFKNAGHRLTNGTFGGDGGATMTGKKMSKEAIAKIIKAQKGKKWAGDDPRRELLRQSQKGKIPFQATLKAIEKNTRNWLVISPDGEKTIIKNLTIFCKNNDLNPSKMYAVAKGNENRIQHKGWKCQEVK